MTITPSEQREECHRVRFVPHPLDPLEAIEDIPLLRGQGVRPGKASTAAWGVSRQREQHSVALSPRVPDAESRSNATRPRVRGTLGARLSSVPTFARTVMPLTHDLRHASHARRPAGLSLVAHPALASDDKDSRSGTWTRTSPARHASSPSTPPRHRMSLDVSNDARSSSTSWRHLHHAHHGASHNTRRRVGHAAAVLPTANGSPHSTAWQERQGRRPLDHQTRRRPRVPPTDHPGDLPPQRPQLHPPASTSSRTALHQQTLARRGDVALPHQRRRGSSSRLAEALIRKTSTKPIFSPDGKYLYLKTSPSARTSRRKDSNSQIYVVNRPSSGSGRSERYITGPGGRVARPPRQRDHRLRPPPRRTRTLHLFAPHRRSPALRRLDATAQEAWAITASAPPSRGPRREVHRRWARGIRRIDVATGRARILPIRDTRTMAEAVRLPHRVRLGA